MLCVYQARTMVQVLAGDEADREEVIVPRRKNSAGCKKNNQENDISAAK